MVMGWPRGCFLPTPGAPLAVSPLSNEPTASVRARMGEPRETPNPKRRRRSRRTAFILPYLLGVAFRETLWPAPNPRRTPAAPLPADAGRSLRLRDPNPKTSCPPSPRAATGQGATKPAGRSRPQKAKNNQKKRQNTNQPNPNPYRRKPARCQPRRRHRARPRWQPWRTAEAPCPLGAARSPSFGVRNQVLMQNAHPVCTLGVDLDGHPRCQRGLRDAGTAVPPRRQCHHPGGVLGAP